MKKQTLDKELKFRLSKSELQSITASALINSPKPSGGGNVNKETRRLISNGHKYDALLAQSKVQHRDNGDAHIIIKESECSRLVF